jgi:uncharacterized membrane protein
MQTIKTIKTLLLVGVIMLVLDALYLTTFTKMFELQIASVQRVSLQFRTLGAIMCYALLISGLYYFILKNRRSVTDAFLLGILIYGVYESTNYAILKQWKWEMVAIDTLWGGILFALTTYFVYNFYDIYVE